MRSRGGSACERRRDRGASTRRARSARRRRRSTRRRSRRRPRRRSGRTRATPRRRPTPPPSPRAPAPARGRVASPISATDGERPEPAREVLDGVVDLHHALLHPARDVDGPAVVAEVALELAEHGRHRVGGERGLARGVEAVDRLDQPERRDLHEVVERLVGAPVAARHPARERQQPLDELLAGGLVAVAVVADQQPPILLGPRRAGGLRLGGGSLPLGSARSHGVRIGAPVLAARPARCHVQATDSRHVSGQWRAPDSGAQLACSDSKTHSAPASRSSASLKPPVSTATVGIPARWAPPRSPRSSRRPSRPARRPPSRSPPATRSGSRLGALDVARVRPVVGQLARVEQVEVVLDLVGLGRRGQDDGVARARRARRPASRASANGRTSWISAM